MKTLQKKELELLAEKFHAQFECDTLPELFFVDENGNEFGFEATEQDGENYYGFRFFGHASKQAELMDLWAELTEHKFEKQMLTVELAKLLTGKKVRTSYCDTNEGEEIFQIIGLEKKKQKQIGQNENYELVTKVLDENKQPTGEDCRWYYEWQGIFRRGSGAERLFVEEIIS